MKNMLLLCFLFWFSVAGSLKAQVIESPEIGKPFPAITFSNVHNYKKKNFTVSEQKGKWLIINFWSLGCTSCFSVFKKIKHIEDAYGDRIQILQVGRIDRDFNADIESIYERISTNMKLKVPAVYDSLFRKYWGIDAYPNMYIIDPQGVLRFITDGSDLNPDKISALLNNRTVRFYPILSEESHSKFDMLSWSANKRVKAMTMISESNGEIPSENVELFAIGDRLPEVRSEGWATSTVSLADLYIAAYFGKELWTRWDTVMYGNIFPRPILEMKDTSLFRTDFTEIPATGTYNCFIKLADAEADSQSYMSALQNLLRETFAYQVSIETREQWVWCLEAKPGVATALRTSGEKSSMTRGSLAGGFVIRNKPVEQLITYLTTHLPYERTSMYIDATNITGNIDFRIEGDLTDFSILQRELARQGLLFVRRLKSMRVLVLKD